jgi:periplasmic divalent cation tolerance protein
LNEFIIVLTAVPDSEAGQIIAERIVEGRLAACATLLSAGQSLYWWEGKITQDQEFIVLIKTTKELYPKLEKTILGIHPHKVPEIIVLPITGGHKNYLDWLEKEVQP